MMHPHYPSVLDTYTKNRIEKRQITRFNFSDLFYEKVHFLAESHFVLKRNVYDFIRRIFLKKNSVMYVK